MVWRGFKRDTNLGVLFWLHDSMSVDNCFGIISQENVSYREYSTQTCQSVPLLGGIHVGL